MNASPQLSSFLAGHSNSSPVQANTSDKAEAILEKYGSPTSKQNQSVLVAPMTQILSNLWLGDISAAHNKFLLLKNGIKSILSLGENVGDPMYPTKFEYLVIGSSVTPNEVIKDGQYCNILQHFISCISFIKLRLAQGRGVLVHCDTGLSISPSIIIAYLAKEKGMNIPSAL